MKIDFLVAMSDSAHGLAISGHLLAEVSERINCSGIDSSELSQKFSGNMNLTVYIDCLSPKDYPLWPGKSVGHQDFVKCWEKIVKPRRFHTLEAYVKFNFQRMNDNPDILRDFFQGLRDCLEYIEATHQIKFRFLRDGDFVSYLKIAAQNNPEKFKAENYYRNFFSTPWSQGLVVF